MVDACESFFDDANAEFKRIQKQEALIQQLDVSRDWTAYYRNSEKLESESEDMIKPVSRYRH